GLLESLRAETKNIPTLNRRYAWLMTDAAKDAMQSDLTQILLAEVKKKNCQEAANVLNSSLTPNSAPEKLNDLLSAGSIVERCFRQIKRSKATQFWVAARPSFDKAFGASGALQVDLRIGYLYWLEDDYENAKKVFNQVVTDATALNQEASLAKAIYTLG